VVVASHNGSVASLLTFTGGGLREARFSMCGFGAWEEPTSADVKEL